MRQVLLGTALGAIASVACGYQPIHSAPPQQSPTPASQAPTRTVETRSSSRAPAHFTIKGQIANFAEASSHLSPDTYLQLIEVSPTGRYGIKSDNVGRLTIDSALPRMEPVSGSFVIAAPGLKPGRYYIAVQKGNFRSQNMEACFLMRLVNGAAGPQGLPPPNTTARAAAVVVEIGDDVGSDVDLGSVLIFLH